MHNKPVYTKEDIIQAIKQKVLFNCSTWNNTRWIRTYYQRINGI